MTATGSDKDVSGPAPKSANEDAEGVEEDLYGDLQPRTTGCAPTWLVALAVFGLPVPACYECCCLCSFRLRAWRGARTTCKQTATALSGEH